MTSDQLAHLVQRAYRAAAISTRRPEGSLVHALRHTFATSLIEHGASLVEVQQLLGHTSPWPPPRSPWPPAPTSCAPRSV